MYSQQDLDDAVASGVISAAAADALRAHIEGQRSTPIADEEQFRLITGFNDIFVSIAAAILLFAVGWIGQWFGQSVGLVIDVDGPSPLAPLAVAATAWPLAMFFTAKRRMALPSILLLLAFVGGVFATALFSLVLSFGVNNFDNNPQLGGVIGALAAAIAAGAAWLHWRQFLVPMTIAAGRARWLRLPSVCWSPRLVRMPRTPRTSSSVSCSCSASGCSSSRCGGTLPTAPVQRVAPTSPSGCTCSQPR